MEEQIIKIIMKTDWSKNSKYDPSDAAKGITSHVFEFLKWGTTEVARLYYRDEIYQVLGTNNSLKSIEELYQYWFKNVKHGK